jgi:hypothetical protein
MAFVQMELDCSATLRGEVGTFDATKRQTVVIPGLQSSVKNSFDFIRGREVDLYTGRTLFGLYLLRPLASLWTSRLR